MPVMQITHGRNKAHVASIREDAAQFGNSLNYLQFSLPSKAMLRIVGKSTRFDIGDVLLHRRLDAVGAIKEVSNKARRLPVRETQHVMENEYLTAASGTCTDADHGYRQRLGEVARKRCGDHFQHQHCGPGGSEFGRVLTQL